LSIILKIFLFFFIFFNFYNKLIIFIIQVSFYFIVCNLFILFYLFFILLSIKFLLLYLFRIFEFSIILVGIILFLILFFFLNQLKWIIIVKWKFSNFYPFLLFFIFGRAKRLVWFLWLYIIRIAFTNRKILSSEIGFLLFTDKRKKQINFKHIGLNILNNLKFTYCIQAL